MTAEAVISAEDGAQGISCILFTGKLRYIKRRAAAARQEKKTLAGTKLTLQDKTLCLLKDNKHNKNKRAKRTLELQSKQQLTICIF